MGILDSLESSGILGKLGAAVLPVVMSEVMGTGSQGGLNAIVAKLEQAGFGDQVKSWIGTGQNLPISADQLRQGGGSWPPSTTFLWISSRRFWRSNCPRLWITRARTASCHVQPERSPSAPPRPT